MGPGLGCMGPYGTGAGWCGPYGAGVGPCGTTLPGPVWAHTGPVWVYMCLTRVYTRPGPVYTSSPYSEASPGPPKTGAGGCGCGPPRAHRQRPVCAGAAGPHLPQVSGTYSAWPYRVYRALRRAGAAAWWRMGAGLGPIGGGSLPGVAWGCCLPSPIGAIGAGWSVRAL